MTSHSKKYPCCKTLLLIFQGFVLLIAIYYFWFPSVFPSPSRPGTIDRADYVWLLAVYVLLVLARAPLTGRLWTRTPLDIWLAAFVLLGLLNTIVAPYESRGWMMLARPLLGIALYLYAAEVARSLRRIDLLLMATVILGTGLGLIALTATQWNHKAHFFRGLIAYYPQVDLWFAPGGFNANEIAGAMSWLIPLMAALTGYAWPRWHRFWQLTAAAALGLMLLALLMGQSRSALIGTLAAAGFAFWLSMPRGRPRRLALALISVLILLQAGVMFNVLPSTRSAPAGTLATGTINQRFFIWQAAMEMVRDYPLTGVGMDRFRDQRVRHDYPIVVRNVVLLPPHAHNELLQVATDLGLPGLGIVIGWNILASVMLWKIWACGQWQARRIAVGAACGLLAHGVYGISDAITFWDRFSFIYWIILGVITAQYILIKNLDEHGLIVQNR